MLTHSAVAPPEDANALTRQQAVDEGHDADIPGHVIDDAGDVKRQQPSSPQLCKEASTSSSGAHDLERAEKTSQGSATDAIRNGAAAEEPAADAVWWDSADDPENPYNWPTWRKATNCTLVSALSFITPLGSSFFAPGVPSLMAEFRSDSPELAAFVVSVYVLGFAAGPLLMAPLSEIYGRNVVYHSCNICFVAFLVACALAPTLNALIAFRFLSGVFGSCPLTNGGGTIADMIAQERRGAAMAAFSVGPLLGPIVGPVAGGFLAEAKGWRWVFWVLAIVAGVLCAVMLVCARESYAPVLLRRKAARLRRETGNPRLRSRLDAGLAPADYFRRGIVRPLKMLVLSPVCAIFALYVAVVYGYLYLMFTSITPVFLESYRFSASNVGLVFLGLGIGSMLGLVFFSVTSDRTLKKMAARDGTGMKPEYRLWPLPIGAVLLPIGFFMYGWTVEYRVHWIVPIISHAIIGVANLIAFMALNMALVDTFTIYAASALAANTLVRSVAGAVLPLCGLKMYDKLGVGWGNSLLGFIALPLIPAAFLIIRYGEYLRTRFPVKNL